MTEREAGVNGREVPKKDKCADEKMQEAEEVKEVKEVKQLKEVKEVQEQKGRSFSCADLLVWVTQKRP